MTIDDIKTLLEKTPDDARFFPRSNVLRWNADRTLCVR